MQSSVKKYGLWIVACVSLLTGGLLGYALALRHRTAHADALHSIARYGNYSSLDWNDIREAYYRPESGDWDAETAARMNPDFPAEIAIEYWHLLQNAKTAFHEQTLPLRMHTGSTGWAALDRVEAQLDTVFVRCVGQPYYLRLFPETYDEVMRPAITDLFQQLAADRR